MSRPSGGRDPASRSHDGAASSPRRWHRTFVEIAIFVYEQALGKFISFLILTNADSVEDGQVLHKIRRA
jgi:hypothetical protein